MHVKINKVTNYKRATSLIQNQNNKLMMSDE